MEDAFADTVGQRLLGLALASMDVNDESCAVKSISEATQLHVGTSARNFRSYRSLARIAFSLLTSDKKPQQVMENFPAIGAEIDKALEAAVQLLKRRTSEQNDYDPDDCGPIAQLCYALAIMRKDDG